MANANFKPLRPIILLVLDGFGVPSSPDSPFDHAHMPTFKFLEENFPFTTLQASGVAVGLPWGEEGNSEVGHLTMGSGRVIYHHLPRIEVSIQDKNFFKNEALMKAKEHVLKNNSSLHFLGLFSSGSVHAYPDHLYALLEFAKREVYPHTKNFGVGVYLHLFTDGRDSALKEAGTFFEQLEERLKSQYPFAKIASVIGRNYAMDRDGHWDKIERAYNLLIKGEGAKFQKASDYLKSEYEAGRTDEFIEPAWFGEPGGLINAGDAVIFFNFREDSARELARAFLDPGFDKFGREKIEGLLFLTMTRYEKDFQAEVLFPPLEVSWPLARVLAETGLKQLHLAETEKYAHVTYFFSGGREAPFQGEERILIPSLPGVRFDQNPEMSAGKITETLLQNLSKYDFILVNFANADMVGHTGNFEATVKALEVLDASLSQILPEVLELGGAMLVTGDHGNAEEKLYRFTGEKRTKHTANPVPLFLVAEEFREKNPRQAEKIKKCYGEVGGILTDIAPTILELMQIPKPSEMTGINLLPKLLGK